VTLIVRPLYWLAGKLFALWARPAIQPETPADRESCLEAMEGCPVEAIGEDGDED